MLLTIKDFMYNIKPRSQGTAETHYAMEEGLSFDHQYQKERIINYQNLGDLNQNFVLAFLDIHKV